MPVVPVAVVGTDVVAPPGKKFGTFTRPVVRFGKPLDFSRYEGMENDRYILRSITDEIMYEIMRLSGQEYVDMYASRAKEESKRRASATRPRAADERRAEAGVLSRTARPLPAPLPPPPPTSRTGCFQALAVLRVVVLLNAVGARRSTAPTPSSDPCSAGRVRRGDGRCGRVVATWRLRRAGPAHGGRCWSPTWRSPWR